MKQIPGLLLRVALFGFTLIFCLLIATQKFSSIVDLIIIVGGILLVIPIVWIGRKILDRWPTLSYAEWTTTFVHFSLIILLGSALIEAVKTHQYWMGWTFPIPEEVGYVLCIVTGVAAVLTVLNLAVKGLGAPFAIALSRKLTADWMYAWTRNPMVLATLSFFLALGLWFRSALFVVWVLVWVTPAWIAFVKIYEEKELEIRFGAPYIEYKSRTAMLFPRRPRRS
jgi:protein-S-isoprenylcysteine O-methyltransferase Ste14